MGLDNKPNSLGTVTVLDWITIMKAFWRGGPSWPRAPTMAPSGGVCCAMGNEFEPATELFQPPREGKMGSCGNGEEVRPGLVA